MHVSTSAAAAYDLHICDMASEQFLRDEERYAAEEIAMEKAYEADMEQARKADEALARYFARPFIVAGQMADERVITSHCETQPEGMQEMSRFAKSGEYSRVALLDNAPDKDGVLPVINEWMLQA